MLHHASFFYSATARIALILLNSNSVWLAKVVSPIPCASPSLLAGLHCRASVSLPRGSPLRTAGPSTRPLAAGSPSSFSDPRKRWAPSWPGPWKHESDGPRQGLPFGPCQKHASFSFFFVEEGTEKRSSRQGCFARRNSTSCKRIQRLSARISKY